VNDYIDNFTAYVLHISTTSKLHQITLFITGLQDPLQATIAQYHPREMEMATTLVHVREHPASTTTNVTQTSPDYTAYSEVDAPLGKMARASAPPPTATPTSASTLLPLDGCNTGAAMHPNNAPLQPVSLSGHNRQGMPRQGRRHVHMLLSFTRRHPHSTSLHHQSCLHMNSR
jgi:hypothetical protein